MPANTSSASSTLVILVHYGDSAETEAVQILSAALAQRLALPVQTAFLENNAPSLGESIQIGMMEHQPRHIIILPVVRGASASQKNTMQMIVDAAQDRWLEIALHIGKPLETHAGVIAAYSTLIETALPTIHDDETKSSTALLVVGRGSRTPESNAEIYPMARLLWEKYALHSAEVAFHHLAQPDIATALRRCRQSGARQVLVLPYVLYEDDLYTRIQQRLIPHEHADLRLICAGRLEVHPGILEALCQRYQEAWDALSQQITSGTRRIVTHSHGAGGSHAHAVRSVSPTFDSLDTLLPPRYQGDVQVSAAPMGAADLVYDAAGNVAWDEIWGDFCDLALAGGPPHRGTLLEPAVPEQIAANPTAYQRVLAELERGIRMITGLPVIAHQYLGWIGMECTDETMALWLLRAILVENVSVRRENRVLYFPAGPDFRLPYEIKNVITVIAKTHHYWIEHLQNQPRAHPESTSS